MAKPTHSKYIIGFLIFLAFILRLAEKQYPDYADYMATAKYVSLAFVMQEVLVLIGFKEGFVKIANRFRNP